MSGAALISWFAFAWAACAALLAGGAIFSRMALHSVAVLDGLLSEKNEDDKLDLVQSRTALLTKSLLAVVAFIGAIIALGIALGQWRPFCRMGITRGQLGCFATLDSLLASQCQARLQPTFCAAPPNCLRSPEPVVATFQARFKRTW